MRASGRGLSVASAGGSAGAGGEGVPASAGPAIRIKVSSGRQERNFRNMEEMAVTPVSRVFGGRFGLSRRAHFESTSSGWADQTEPLRGENVAPGLDNGTTVPVICLHHARNG
jgi:hypothetical protein